MSCVPSTVLFPAYMNRIASTITCPTRYSTSCDSARTASSFRDDMPTDSATSRTLSGFQTSFGSPAILITQRGCCWSDSGAESGRLVSKKCDVFALGITGPRRLIHGASHTAGGRYELVMNCALLAVLTPLNMARSNAHHPLRSICLS